MKKKFFILCSVFSIFIQSANATEDMPEAKPLPRSSIKMSLNEAVLLAVRNNPNVQSTQLNLVLQKFNTWVQEWQFYPHYGFQASAVSNSTKSNGLRANSEITNVQPSVSLLTPIGTQLTLSGNNTNPDHYTPGLSLEVSQPLIRGFGTAVVEAQLNNAKDSELIARMNVEGILRTTVTDVVNAYLSVVAAERTVSIDEDAVKRAETSVKQTKLFIEAGHKAGNELVTVQANVASAKTQLENDKNNLIQTQYGLLSAIGIDPNTDVDYTSLDIEGLINKYHFPTLEQTKSLVLQNDIQYQTDQITLHGQTQRNLLVAEDNTKWQLNFNANVATGGGVGMPSNQGLSGLVNGMNQSQSVGLTLEIPIDDQQAKQAVMSAKIALQQAELALKQEKWGKETSAINAWNSVLSAERAFKFADDAEKLQEKTYNLSYQKYLHGLIDSLELQSALQSLVQSKQALLNARINYLRALVSLDLLVGNTLKTWKINART
jgi:outer membrane protein